MLDVRRLRVLSAVARHGSLSAAAVELGYTQPAVSRQIAVLESEVGMVLLRRLPHGVTLTDAGRLLVQRADEVLISLARTEDELRAHADLNGGTLRMAAFSSGAATVVPLALARFRERHPAVELIVSVADPIDSLPLLRAGELDLALCNGPEVPGAGPAARGRSRRSTPTLALDAIDLFDDPLYVVLPAAHRLADRPRLTLGLLAGESWMLASAGSCPDAELFLDACESAGIEPRVAFQYDDYAALLGFVSAGVGISVIPDMVARGVRDDVAVRRLDPPLPARPIQATVPSGYRPPAVAAMLEVLAELVSEWVAGRVDTDRYRALAGRT